MASTDHEYGRHILLGIRAWCEQHPGFQFNIISTQAQMPEGRIGLSLLGIVGFFVDLPSVQRARRLAPHVVTTSNRSHLPGVPKVVSDDLAVGRMGARYLLARGFRQLVLIKRSGHLYSDQRAEGLREVAASQGVDVHEFDWQGNPLPVDRILALPPPRGIMTVSDTIAREFLEKIASTPIHVPQDLAILGVNDDSLENALSPVALSSVRLAGQTVGYRAAETVYQLSQRRRVSLPILVPPVQVVTRRSTDVFAVRDPLVERALRLMRQKPADLRLVQDLVAALKIPRRTLELRFRKATGRSLYQELTECHIELARQLLAGTDEPVGDIALRCGFSEPRLLSLVFRRLTGMPPSAYRTLFVRG